MVILYKDTSVLESVLTRTQPLDPIDQARISDVFASSLLDEEVEPFKDVGGAPGDPLDTSTFGTKTFMVTAEDNAGNNTIKTVTNNVFFNFSGFFPPVDNWPKMNKRNAGSNVPVRFSLGGNQGLDIFAQGYPKSQEIPCNNLDVEVAGTDPTSSPGGSDLTCDAGLDQYHYNWKTEKGWEGTCRQLVAKLKDSSFHCANFQFTSGGASRSGSYAIVAKLFAPWLV
jgi:hypothetical protein